MATGFAKFVSEAVEEDLHTWNFMLTYENIRKQVTGLVIYFAIPREIDPRKHKNWLQFEKARIVCDQNNIDYQDYLLAQFIGVQNWKDCPIPFPNQLATEGALDRYSKCVVRWNKISARIKRDIPVDKSTVEYYEEKVRDYVQKMGMAGVKASVSNYIAFMTGMGLFPEWYANNRVPDWRSRAEKAGISLGTS